MDFREIGQRISVKDALSLICSKTSTVGVQEVDVADSLGRIAASDIRSQFDVPHFDRSAMDGFAVIASDTFGCSQRHPARFEVIGECKVGETPVMKVALGKAIEVATGSQVPNGADAIIKVENTSRSGCSLNVFFPVTPGENISRIGEDVKRGDIIIDSGQIIRPQDISILLACGVLSINVSRKPTVGVVASGNELVEPQGTPVAGKVFNVNSYSLSAYVTLYGGIPFNLGIVGDSFEELKKTLQLALKYDLVVFSGSTSVGKMDMLPDVVSSIGEILFRGVSMRPGAPTSVGFVCKRLVFLLPGFPAASMIAFETFIGPTIRKMMGARKIDPRNEVSALLGSRVTSALGRRDYVRVRLRSNREGELVAQPLRSGGSSIISSMTKADGIVEIPEDIEGLEKGSKVLVRLFPK